MITPGAALITLPNSHEIQFNSACNECVLWYYEGPCRIITKMQQKMKQDLRGSHNNIMVLIRQPVPR